MQVILFLFTTNLHNIIFSESHAAALSKMAEEKPEPGPPTVINNTNTLMFLWNSEPTFPSSRFLCNINSHSAEKKKAVQNSLRKFLVANFFFLCEYGIWYWQEWGGFLSRFVVRIFFTFQFNKPHLHIGTKNLAIRTPWVFTSTTRIHSLVLVTIS